MRTIKNALANLVQTAILNFKMATKNRVFIMGGGGCMGTPVGLWTMGAISINMFWLSALPSLI